MSCHPDGTTDFFYNRVDIVEEVLIFNGRLRNHFCISRTRVKIMLIIVAVIDGLYKKNALPGFNDRLDDENIDDITNELTKVPNN